MSICTVFHVVSTSLTKKSIYTTYSRQGCGGGVERFWVKSGSNSEEH